LRPDLAQLDQLEAERFNLREDAEHRGPILEQTGEYGVPAVDVMDHRGKGGQRGGPEAAMYSDAVQVGLGVHDVIIRRKR
jgi:hypothetical protein